MFGKQNIGKIGPWKQADTYPSGEKGIYLPSDLKSDPRSRGFLTDLSNQCFHLQKSNSSSEIPLKKVLIPPMASDDVMINAKKKTVFVDSAFFSPQQHPTWEEQVAMAKKISQSLSDASNRQSKGQNMYEKRKRRSPKWIHQGGWPLGPDDYMQLPTTPQSKPMLKLVMNPQGQEGPQDLQALRAKGLLIDEEGGLSPQMCYQLSRNLQSDNGRGGQIFAKRKKRSEKWVVDEFHPEQNRTGDPRLVIPKARPPLPPTPPTAQPVAPAKSYTQPVTSSDGVTPVHLTDLCRSPQIPRFPTDGVYSPRVAQGWGQGQPIFPPPAPVQAPEVYPVSDIDAPVADIAGTAYDMVAPAAVDTTPEAGLVEKFERPPACVLTDTIEESLRLIEERRRQRHADPSANYNTAARGWGSQGVYYTPVTFTES